MGWHRRTLVAAICTSLMRGSLAGAQTPHCEPQWQPGGGIPGTAGPVRVVHAWNDGSSERLYIGGQFTFAGESVVNGLAQWDGVSMTSVGGGVTEGLIFSAAVNALCGFKGDLIVGGEFYKAGDVDVSQIARWDGAAWHDIGGGVSGSASSAQKDGAVVAMMAHGEDLIVGGWFLHAGGVPAPRIARWDGSAWHAMGAGFDNGGVNALEVYNGQVIAAGYFTTSAGVAVNRIARWDGSAWQPFGPGLYSAVNDLAVHDGHLIAVGQVFFGSPPTESFVARWNGTMWAPMGVELTWDVLGLTVHDGELLALGQFFEKPNGDPIRRVARWNGTAWEEFGGGVGAMDVRTACEFQDSLVIGGSFNEAGGAAVGNVAKWSEGHWSAIGPTDGTDRRIYSLERIGKDIIATGEFTRIGGTAASGVARYDGKEWHAMGSGLTRFPYLMSGQCSIEFQGDVVVGGIFDHAGGVPAEGIARWDGANWHAMGEGLAGYVRTLAVYDGQVIASGTLFDFEDIAAWDGTMWQPLGAGINSGANAMTVYDGDLVVAGGFSQAGGQQIRRIAKWDGSAWMPFAQPLTSGIVDSMVVFNGELIISGGFSWDGGPSTVRTARWDEPTQTWQAMDAPFNVSARSLTVIGGQLIACGSYVLLPAFEWHYGLFRWDGSEWHAFGDELETPPWDVAEVDDGVLIGGPFIYVGDVFSPYLARGVTTAKPGDVNCDSIVDVTDLLTILANWGPCPSPPAICPADIAPFGSPDGVVDAADLNAIIVNWG